MSAAVLTRWLPMRAWWDRVNRATLRSDAAAGLSGALIVLPQGIAYAAIAGLPPEYGLYCAIGPAMVAGLFGSSWHLVSGPTAAISIVVFSALSPLAAPGSVPYITLALTLGLLVGAIQLALGLVRLGRLADLISHSVIVGFTAGAALLIVASQLRHFFGLEVPARTGFFPVVAEALRHLPQLNPAVTAVGVATVLVCLLARRLLPRWPHLVIAMLAGSLVALAWPYAGAVIPLVGALPAAIPPLSLPSFSLDDWNRLGGSAVAIAILGLTEAVAIARAIAMRSGQTIDGNQEFVGQGLANLTGSFFSGYPSSGSFTRSGVNFEAGAQTPLAAVFASLILMAILYFIAPIVAFLPIAAMAGVLFVVARGLVDWPDVRRTLTAAGNGTARDDKIVLCVTFFATLLIALEFAVFVGILFSLILRALRNPDSGPV
ncbi:MAG: SulP family inorganic anion transporter [Betaproteobacteria bacterium]